jgi:hypothetical protein
VKLSPAPVFVALLACALGGCGSHASAGAGRQPGNSSNSATTSATASGPAVKPASRVPVVSAPGRPGPQWTPVVTIAGQQAAWIAERSRVTLMRVDQGQLRLALHAGSSEPGGGGWRYGSQIGAREVHRVVAGFNGGFRLNYGSVGFLADGRVAVPLTAGLGSIVTYRDGATQIGAWQQGVPARARPIESVLQDLSLLVDHGAPASTVETCATGCWGSTLGGGANVARSALGVRADGQLVWAAGESLSPSALANALTGAGVQRAVELDINPEWVAGYLYLHRAGGPAAAPVVPGQAGIAGQLLAPYSRDFFTLIAR